MDDQTPKTPGPVPGEDPTAAFRSESGLPEYFYDEASCKFLMRNSAREWVVLGETALRRELRRLRLSDKADAKAGQLLSPIDAIIAQTEQDRRVAFAGIVAGWPAGLHTIAGQRVLVTKSPELIAPRQVPWPTIAKLVEGLLVGDEPAAVEGQPAQQIDQRDRFYAWVQHTVQCLYAGRVSSGLALCISGERNCGKTRLADLIRAATGGRVSKPYDYMIGRENFNRGMGESVLQLVDDENADTSISARLHLAAQIKKLVANSEINVRAMYRDGVSIQALLRLVMLTNIEAHRLLVLPPVDGDIADKLLMLKAYQRPKPDPTASESERACWPLPMPTRTEAERERWRETIAAELPGWLWWLLREYVPPAEIVGGRFIVQHWQHPQILSRLQRFAPHVRLWELIERSGVVWRKKTKAGEFGAPDEWQDCTTWEGSAGDLETLLKGPDSKLSNDERREVPVAAWLGQRLESLRDSFGSEVVEFRRAKKQLWTLHRKQLTAE